jgi:hypothetical protein
MLARICDGQKSISKFQRHFGLKPWHKHFQKTDRMVEKAAANVEDLLRLEAKLTGTYPKARLHTLVEEWYEQNNMNAADTLWTIQALKNKKYRVTCENYLSRLSGKTIGKIKQELLDEFNGGDVFFSFKPQTKLTNPIKIIGCWYS